MIDKVFPVDHMDLVGGIAKEVYVDVNGMGQGGLIGKRWVVTFDSTER